MIPSEQVLKIRTRRSELETLSRGIKSRICGVKHGPQASKDQYDLEVLVRPELTACHVLLASLRGKEHLSEKTSELTRKRVSRFSEAMIL